MGVIELAPNVPKHLKVGGIDWTITEGLLVDGKHKIIAECDCKSTKQDPADTPVGSVIHRYQDMTGLPSGVECLGYFGYDSTRFTLKYDEK